MFVSYGVFFRPLCVSLDSSLPVVNPANIIIAPGLILWRISMSFDIFAEGSLATRRCKR